MPDPSRPRFSPDHLPSNSLGQKNGQEKQVAAWRHAATLTPRGVHSNFRFWGDDATPVMERGKGSHLFDLDGNEYIDFRSGFGSIILGHGYDPVCDAVNEAVRNGCVFTLTTPWETRVVERMKRMVPGLEMVRFCCSGTEASMHAVRVARAITGKEKIIKFEGHYHGAHDYLLWSTAGSYPGALGCLTDPVPYQMGSGIPKAMRELIYPLPFNHPELLEQTVRKHAHELAAIICEPMMGNAASIMPRPGFLELIRKLCDEYGILFILDEVKTGFRIAPGGAQELFNIRADLVLFAKAIANGFPLAAFGGKKVFMDAIGPGQIVHGGTYNGNIASMAAADFVLSLLEDGEVLRQIGRQGEKLSSGMSEIFTRFEVPHVISGPPQMWQFMFAKEPAQDFRSLFKTQTALYQRIASELVTRGVLPEPDVREPFFMTWAHSDEDIAYVLQALEDVLNSLPDSVLHPKVGLEIPDA